MAIGLSGSAGWGIIRFTISTGVMVLLNRCRVPGI